MATTTSPKGRLTRLRLKNFKSFAEADIKLGPLTVLVGTNASGKSNLRDAFRFLHGISRGYTLAEIIGEKWIEGGVLQWGGIRGGIREIAAHGAETFGLEIEYESAECPEPLRYNIEVAAGRGIPLCVLRERFFRGNKGLFAASASVAHPMPPLITKGPEAKELVSHLASMRFLDLDPDAMRLPSTSGQVILGDRGENLSSVLQAIANDPKQQEILAQWIQELTPMDVRRLEFPPDQTGKVLLRLVEENGQGVSAYSASDGTLRFLAMIAALLGPEPARFYFFEELENGIHPTRLHLLLELIEQKVFDGGIQMVATTHSPQLLGLLSPQSREYAALTYRLPGKTATEVKRIVDIPEAKTVLDNEDWAALHASGWLENVATFAEDPERATHP